MNTDSAALTREYSSGAFSARAQELAGKGSAEITAPVEQYYHVVVTDSAGNKVEGANVIVEAVSGAIQDVHKQAHGVTDTQGWVRLQITWGHLTFGSVRYTITAEKGSASGQIKGETSDENINVQMKIRFGGKTVDSFGDYVWILYVIIALIILYVVFKWVLPAFGIGAIA